MFATDRREQELAARLGRDRDPKLEHPDEAPLPPSASRVLDGETILEELSHRDLFKRLIPVVQSREGDRSPDLYLRILVQFSPGKNPRYDPDAPERPRGHIYAWDVTRALHCELPHFMGTRELNLVQTCDWLRELGSTQGWRKLDLPQALAAAASGMPVLVLPKDTKLRHLALLRPARSNALGPPRVAAVALVRGHDLVLEEALGTPHVQCFQHA